MKTSSWTENAITEREIRLIRRKLLAWGRANFKSFPWRNETDPWLTFVTEFFLQRTRASQVAKFFREFKVTYPTSQAFVEAGEVAVRFVTHRLGLHWRGPLLAEIARDVAERGGAPPDNYHVLIAYKGIGDYTASAWLSLYRGKRAVLIDSNVVRWLSRMTAMPYNRDPRGLKWVQALCQKLTPSRVFRDYNFATLDFTMNVCTVRKPACTRCPFKALCQWPPSQQAPE